MALITGRSRTTGAVSSDSAAIAQRLLDGVVLVESRGGSGSGVIWQPDGLIVTNSHVVHRERASIYLQDGRRFDAELIGRAATHDLAALRVKARGLPAVEVGDSSRVRVGQLVFAAGNPLGMRGVVTAGVITGAGQVSWDGETRLKDLLQADVALAPGNSGGPLADAEGRVLGINSMVSSSGMALAIPSQIVLDFLSPGEQMYAYIGISGMNVTVGAAGEHRRAVLLTGVEEGSPADRAGLIQGDVLLQVGGRDVRGVDDLRRILGSLRGGEGVQLTLLRGGTAWELIVVPSARMAA
ncbi:MAG: trypsin-like peptidase domain-containing protein [Chloroflexota bacterium]|nr:trypsin-like peptidase domain-containing protein [Chloroflexota bacterium]